VEETREGEGSKADVRVKRVALRGDVREDGHGDDGRNVAGVKRGEPFGSGRRGGRGICTVWRCGRGSSRRTRKGS
jgi:hypothetical protein